MTVVRRVDVRCGVIVGIAHRYLKAGKSYIYRLLRSADHTATLDTA